jgi:cell division septal protein FtsQ
MRDYKNVKVPKKYRVETGRVRVKRVEAGRSGQQQRGKMPGIGKVFANLFALTAIGASCWLGWQAYRFTTTAELFRISGVDVTGVRELGRSDLKNIADEFTGQNIFRVDLTAAVRRALANPWIKEARIHRTLPNRIAMTVVERVPRALLQTQSGTYLTDGEGVVIDRAGKDDGIRGLPSIVIKDYRPSRGEPVNAESITEALNLLTEIETRGGWNVSEVTIRADSPEMLTVLYAGYEFRMGSGKYSVKLRRLAEVIADVKQRGLNIAYVDLRPDRQAAAMMKDSKSTGKISNKKRRTGKKH